MKKSSPVSHVFKVRTGCALSASAVSSSLEKLPKSPQRTVWRKECEEGRWGRWTLAELGSLLSCEAAQSPAPCSAVRKLIDWVICKGVLVTSTKALGRCHLHLPPFLSLEKGELRLSFADMREKKPRKSGGDRKGATHTGMSSGREEETDNRAQEWKRKAQRRCRTPGGRRTKTTFVSSPERTVLHRSWPEKHGWPHGCWTTLSFAYICF